MSDEVNRGGIDRRGFLKRSCGAVLTLSLYQLVAAPKGAGRLFYKLEVPLS